ncbi:MAG: DUF308 domain-containing protein [Pseudonocardiaceae bacterium]|nr:DUF308 domain-containing protein [Pseudonocardia sp.]
MSYLDPEERSNDGSGDSVEDTDVAFARIVAGLRAEGLRAEGLRAQDLGAQDLGTQDLGTQDLGTESEEPDWPARDFTADTGEDHFDPPEPPPLPMPRPRTVGGVLTLAVGVLLLAASNLVGLGERVATPLGLLAVTAGIGWLVIGLRPGPSAAGSDDGARL